MARTGRHTVKKRKTATKARTGRSRTVAKRASKRIRAVARSARSAARRAVKQARRTARSANTGHDAISLLKADHKELRQLLEQLKATEPGDRRERLLTRVREALESHTKIEEEIFYPAYRDAAAAKKDRVLYFEALEEHHAVDMILPEVASASREQDVFPARAKVLKEVVEHHAEEEESEMFPRARRLLPPAELRRLGMDMATRKRSLQKPTGGFSAVTHLFSR
jgi:hypothetical protein